MIYYFKIYIRIPLEIICNNTSHVYHRWQRLEEQNMRKGKGQNQYQFTRKSTANKKHTTNPNSSTRGKKKKRESFSETHAYVANLSVSIKGRCVIRHPTQS